MTMLPSYALADCSVNMCVVKLCFALLKHCETLTIFNSSTIYAH